MGDPDLIFQMVSNLLDNAVKYAPVGGGLRLSAVRDLGGVTVMVADDGPGVPATDRERVFERFYRRSSDPNGFGLGLSLVAAAAERHGAKITLTDAEPGLRVTVRFPEAV